MVSARPPPTPSRGRVAYPSAANYTSGDADSSPAYLLDSEPVEQVTSRDSDRERAQGLKTWWKSFRERTEPPPRAPHLAGRPHGGVFGVPLSESIQYASVQISTASEDGALYIWGVIPVVVAKCGLHLKENATEVEGTFRISGSAKRMRDLQAVFDTGPKYGKNIDWKSLPYTSHDVATIFRRFLTQMPEPIIPFDYYEVFRQTLNDEEPTESLVTKYKHIIRGLPAINRYLLLYVLDLLHVFAKNSDKNLMTTPNLALIFQPGVLSHPMHAMRPRDHVLSQHVLEFLIENQDHFLTSVPPKPKKNASANSSRRPTSPTPPSPPPPVAVKADADLMLPSDSDDEAPVGGYYVVEAPPRPRFASSKPSAPERTLSNPVSTLEPTPSRSSPLEPIPSRTALPVPTEHMEPSDSDDDAPPGGYQVRSSDPAKARAELLARPRRQTTSTTDRREPVIPVERKTTATNTGATGLARRRTVPARLLGGTRPRLEANMIY